MKENDFIYESNQLIDGKVKWIAPSNIALVKYWGKKSVSCLKIHPLVSPFRTVLRNRSNLFTKKKKKNL